MRVITRFGALAIAASLAAFMPASAVLAAPGQHEHGQQTEPAQGSGMKMGGMQMGDMAAKKKANAERIATLMATVKSASGEAKVTAMADVIAILLEERTAMQEHCATACAMMKK